MKKKILLGLLLLMLLLPVGGCELVEEERPNEADQAARVAAEQKARSEALATGRALAAAQEAHFVPSPAQAATLAAGLALNPAGTPNGYFTNPEGVSGYFQNYDRPFNFIWTGATMERRTFDGQTLQLVDGPGELLLKYADDTLLLQRFKGEFKDGLWDGHGEHWIRNREADGHNYLHYVGEFKHDRMDGRGVLVNYNFGGGEAHPVRYEGEMSNNAFHGRGLTTDLATGRMIYKGLWLDDQPFPGSQDDWRKADAQAELNTPARQYSDVLMTDNLMLAGFINSRPGQGALTVFPPEGVENVVIIDHNGRSHSAGLIPHPVKKGEDQSALDVPGINLDLSPSEYPATLTLNYDWDGKRQLLRLTVKRPFGLELKHFPQTDAPSPAPSAEREAKDIVDDIIEHNLEKVTGGAVNRKPENPGQEVEQ